MFPVIPDLLLVFQKSEANGGIRARINRKAFEDISPIAEQILNSEITKARLPPISQCIPQADGCLQIYNIFVARYKCPTSVKIRPAEPNVIRISVKGLDIGVTSNLGGRFVILMPIQLFGIVQANLFHVSLKKRLSKIIRKMAPPKICQQLPQVINEKLSGKLSAIPQSISVGQMVDLFGSALGLEEGGSETTTANQTLESLDAQNYEIEKQAIVRALMAAMDLVDGPEKNDLNRLPRASRNSMEPESFGEIPKVRRSSGLSSGLKRKLRQSDDDDDSSSSATPSDPMALLKQFASKLDFKKLDDVSVSLGLVKTEASKCGFAVDLDGEFSQNAVGGTPYTPIRTDFPEQCDSHQAELILSDYSINTLLYNLHQKDFLSVSLGPDTPVIGALLKDCTSDDEDDDEDEDNDVQLDDEDEDEDKELKKKKRHVRHHKKSAKRHTKRSTRRAALLKAVKLQRDRRQIDLSSLSELGFCFGALPGIKEKYAGKTLSLTIHTNEVPKLEITGGEGKAEVGVDVDIYLNGTQTKIATIVIHMKASVKATLKDGTLKGSLEIDDLKINDKDGSTGFPQDAFDNISSLAKDMLGKVASEALEKGIPVEIPKIPSLPIEIVNPEAHFIEHGLYIATDITTGPEALGLLGVSLDSGAQC
ncbi:unnamed protein product, partial [Mesorhabditis spiculigera]